jgi:hypothetical protein
LEDMAIIHDEHCHVVEHKKTGDSGMRSNGKGNDAGSRSSGYNARGSSHGGTSNKASDPVTERSPDMEGRRNRRALESSRPESRRLASHSGAKFMTGTMTCYSPT